MTPEPARDPHYWLLTSETPSGPFDRAAIEARLAAGELSPRTRACRVGESAWQPIAAFPEWRPAGSVPDPRPDTLGPEASTPSGPGEPAAGPRPPDTVASNSVPAPAVPPPAGDSWAAVIGILVLGLAGYAIYEAVRPATPREVVRRFFSVKTAAETRSYAVPALGPAIDAMTAASPGPTQDGDSVEITHDAPSAVGGGHDVWVRIGAFDTQAGRPLAMETRVHLVRADGWKVDDLWILHWDGQPVDPPVSLARAYRQLFSATAPPPQGPPPETTPTPANRKVGVLALIALLKAGNAKAIGLAVVGILVGIGAFFRNRRKGVR